MNFPLESLYIRLGRPVWFWPTVLSAIVLLWIVASSLEVME